MMWLLIGLGIPVTLVLAMAVIGMFLPQGHKASRSIRLTKPATEIWKILTDYPKHPDWRKNLKSVEVTRDSAGAEMRKESTSQGIMSLRTIESIPPKRLVAEIADKNLPFGGKWTYELSDVQGGSILTITEDGEVYNPIFRFMSKYFFGHTSSIDQFLTSLAVHTGSESKPAPS